MIGLVFVAVLLALIWGVVVAVELPLAIAVIPTVTAVVAVLVVVLVRFLQARKAAQQLEGSLKSQDAEHENAVRPDMKPEVKAMRAEFNKALASIKDKRGSSALAVLPWYMIIGPPGGGKSTALRNSGLQFPYVSKRGGGVKGVGGTRNCEWWFTKDAIVLDTAGRYAVEEDDHDEWLSFLSTVVKSRPRKPINGLIVAISVSELMGTEEEAAERGTMLRERVDEVLAKARMNVPVYVLFTKCDLISGFVEMFSDLGRTERGQVWGFTEPLAGLSEGATAIFQQRMGGLVENLEHRALLKLQKNRRIGAREKIWQFPREFAGLQSNLSEFIGALFAENPVSDTPPMRGVYFTSGTQEGKPFDRIMSSMAEAFGVATSTAGEEAGATEARSYFLKDLFSEIVFPDHDIAVASTAETKRLKQLRLWGVLGAVGLALCFSILPGLSFRKNLELVRETRDALIKSKAVLASADLAAAVEKLERLRAQVEKLKGYHDDGAPIGLHLGMYVGGDLFDLASTSYVDLTKRLLITRVLDAEADELRDLSGQPEMVQATAEVAEAIEKLKLHLVLTTPKAEDEPELDQALGEWASQRIVSRWASAGELATEEAQALALSDIQLFAALLVDRREFFYTRDQALLKSTRHAMAKVPVAQLTLSRVIANPAFDDLSISLGSQIGTASRYIKGDKVVRGAFTKKAWESTVRGMLDSAKDESDAWVLGLSQTASAIELRVEYFRLYIVEWKQFIESLRVEPPKSNDEAMAMLEELTRTRPFTTLFGAIAVNTKLAVDSEGIGGLKAAAKKGLGAKLGRLGGVFGGGLADAGVQALNRDPAAAAAKELENTFKGLAKFGYAPPPPEGQPPIPTPLLLYMEDLEKLRDAQRNAIENTRESAPLTTLLSTVRVRVKSSVDQQEPGWRPTIERFVWPPISRLTQANIAAAAEEGSNEWCSQVAMPFGARLAGKYPFRKGGKDVSLDDTAEFYKPGGLVDAFYESVLKRDVKRSGDRFEFVKKLGDAPPYSEGLLQFLHRAKEIQSALFPPQSPEPKVDFLIHIRPAKNVASTTITIDGETYEYRNGQEEWRPMKWPGPQKGSGASVRVKSKQGQGDVLEFPGEWGLFRLLESGGLASWPGERGFAVTWDAPTLGSQLTIDFRPARTDNPFHKDTEGSGGALFDLLRGPFVSPPASIGLSTPPCKKP